MHRARLAKIVATIGPASAAPHALARLHEAGVDVFRLNFSHGAHESHAAVIAALRDAEKRIGRPIAILADLQGPKLRVGAMPDGAMTLKFGDRLRLEAGAEPSVHGTIRMPHPEIIAAAKPGATLLLDDGKLRFEITDADANGVFAKVIAGGVLKDRKGVSLVGASLAIPALTEKDAADLEFALSQEVDWVALSFVQHAADVRQVATRIAGRARLLAKIEKPTAVDEIEEIVAACDGVMVARGDLGIELSFEQVPIAQRKVVRAARLAGKPVIVATHMLESMIESSAPTRAEASDVATAIYQGADAVMLSAETAVGRHPEAPVAMMDRIIQAVERDPEHWSGLGQSRPPVDGVTAFAIASAARAVAADVQAACVVAYSRTGASAFRMAAQRPPCRVLALSPSEQSARQLALAWGVVSHLSPDITSFDEMVSRAEAEAVNTGAAEPGDRIVILAGAPFGEPGKTNTIKVSRIGG
jgi:pyruvate kinase